MMVTSDLPSGIVPGMRVTVLGHGREGSSAADFLTRKGARVTIADRRHACIATGDGLDLVADDPALLDDSDLLVLSPGIPDSNPMLVAAQQRGIPVRTPTQFFFELCPCQIIGVTGSNGKSTTSALIASIVSSALPSVQLGGNIGHPMLDLLPRLSDNSVVIVELSSFQLQRLEQSPHIAVVTNVTPNHLDRHGTFQAYLDAKANILRYQSHGDITVLNANDPNSSFLSERTSSQLCWFGQCGDHPGAPCATVIDNKIVYSKGQELRTIMSVDEVGLPGRHNIENVLAAVAATASLVAGPAFVRDAIRNFAGLPHRLEDIATVGGVRYVNDSIATSPERAAVGVESIDSPIILLAGGRSKHLSWHPLAKACQSKVRVAVLFGEAADELAEGFSASSIELVQADSLMNAVQIARGTARPGETVLLSPGCTSFDAHTDFEERGRAFASMVRQ